MAFLTRIVVLLLVIKAISSASVPSQSRADEYRLPAIFSPISYNVELTVPPEVLTPTSNAFSGRVTLRFTVISPTNEISLNAQNQFISINRIDLSSITVINATTTDVSGGAPGGGSIVAPTTNSTAAPTANSTAAPTSNSTLAPIVPNFNATPGIARATLGNVTETVRGNVNITSYSIDPSTITIRVPDGLITIPVYELTIEYTGNVSTSDMYGFYKSSYTDGNGSTKYLLATQLQPIHARRVFPCFDEPALKATFDFTISVPTGLNVLFNTQQRNSSINRTSGLTTITFNTTPRMSTYLVAFIISEFTCTSGLSIGTVPYQVCSRNNSAATRAVAVEYGPQLLERLINFTNYNYSRAIGKLDLVAIPDFAAGAMENWGLVTYRETALLWDRNQSSNRYLQRIATVIAHELAHQWFGNLVTMRWWSETFLNEGFATYFEFHITDEVLPSWELKKQFVVEELHLALASDAMLNAKPLQYPALTPAEIASRFSTISYSKGGSILRMVEHIMQLGNFKNGLHNYLVEYEYNNTVPEDLWAVLNRSVVNSISKLPANLSKVMENWVKLPGFPVLNANLRGNRITISQKRFLLSGEDSISEWYVPISYTTSVDTNKFETTTPSVWLTPDEDVEIILPEKALWIILNNQQSGYYRVNYDEALWDRIRLGLLRENFDGISEINRAQIVDDLFNLARANQIRYSFIFRILTFLFNDVSYFSWYPAFAGYNFLLRRIGETSRLGQAISNNILETMGKLYLSAPLSITREDDQIFTLTQVLVHSWACRLRAPNCIKEVRNRFENYRSTGVRPNRNLRAMVYCYALKYSNDSSDWNFLWEAYLNSTSLATEQVTILAALGCTADVFLLRGYLNKSITAGSGIRPQDAQSVFTSIYGGSSVGVDVAFDFLIQNHGIIAEKYQSMNALGNLIRGIAQRFTTESQTTRLRDFIDKGDLTEEFRIAASEALETAEANLRWLQEFEDDLAVHFSASGRIKTSFAAVIVAVICTIVAK